MNINHWADEPNYPQTIVKSTLWQIRVFFKKTYDSYDKNDKPKNNRKINQILGNTQTK